MNRNNGASSRYNRLGRPQDTPPAAQNPRFCGSVDDAKAFFAGRRPGDSNAMIAAFPYIVYEALPEAPDVTPAQTKALGNYPININVAVDIKIDKYIHQLPGVGWEAIQDELEKVIAPTATNRAALCATFEKHLEEALSNGIEFNKSTDLTLGMAGPRDMKCEGYPKYPLGKTASIKLEQGKDVFDPSFFKSANYKGNLTDKERAKLVKELIGAMIAMQERLSKGRNMESSN
jgi:hypothetical protein